MQNRNMSKNEFIEYIKGIRFSEGEEKEINSFLRKIAEIERLRNETNQEKSNYNYLKKIMLPSDYRKINKDLLKQREYKVARETHRYSQELKEKGLSDEQIKSKVEDYKQNLCRIYGVGRTRNSKVIQEEELTLDDIDNIEMEE